MINKKKILLTAAAAIVIGAALFWVFWLVFYFDAVIDGSVYVDLSDSYIRFEHRYLVPVQIFGITLILSVLSPLIYTKTRKKMLISRKYIILVLAATLPFWYLAGCHLHSIIYNYDKIYN